MLVYLKNIRRVVEDRVKSFIDGEEVPFVYVDFSGGKDSSIVLKAVDNVTDKYVATYIQIAGQTHADNIVAAYGVVEKLRHRPVKLRVIARRRNDVRRFFYRVLDKYDPPLFIHIVSFDYTSGLDYWRAIEKYGFPAPLERTGNGKRWCCSLFKSKWLAERPVQRKNKRYIVSGVRRDESWFRKRLWVDTFVKEFRNSDGTVDVVLAPIVDLNEAEIWLLLKQYGIYDIVHKQYEKWKRAPNCMLCPLMSHGTLKIAVENLPKSFQCKVREVLEKIEERYTKNSFTYKNILKWKTILC